MKKLFSVIVFAAVLSGCGNTSDPIKKDIQGEVVSNEQLSVVASFYPLAYLAERVGGEGVSVTNVVGASDPHDYIPSPNDIKEMRDADVVLLQGAHLEPWGESMAAQLSEGGVNVIIVSESLDLHSIGGGNNGSHAEYDKEKDEYGDEGHDDHHDEHADEHHGEERADEHSDEHAGDDHHDEHGHDHGGVDPHTWLDPSLAQEMAIVIANALIAVDSDSKEIYTANMESVQEDFAILDKEYSAGLATCERDSLIISHDAFGYIARRYGFTDHGISGLSTLDEPSAETLASLKKEAESGITHILTEENTAGRFTKTLSDETGLALLPINALAAPDPKGTDFIERARTNLKSLQEALGCTK